MHVLFVAATAVEIMPAIDFLNTHFKYNSALKVFTDKDLSIHPLITGVGMVATTWAMSRIIQNSHGFDWALNAGICGALDYSFRKGDVVQIIKEQFGDLGIEQADGGFVDLFELGLADKNNPPFKDGCLYNTPAEHAGFLTQVNGVTVNKVQGNIRNIEAFRSRYPDAQAETMESAAFFYTCLMEKIPFTAIRSVSNYVEARNRANWDIPLAITNLNNVLVEIFKSLQEIPG